MNMELLSAFLGWATVLNLALLLFWFAVIAVAPQWVYGCHARWFPISEKRFMCIHYSLLGGYKLAVILFNLTPYLVLQIVAL